MKNLDRTKTTFFSTAALLSVLSVCGCASVRTDALPVARHADDLSRAGIRAVAPDGEIYFESESEMVAHLRVSGGHRSISVLALTGGGVDGAFGAGVLVGLSNSGKRPNFSVVTGVSAGALLAPYAFLGPDWDRELAQIYSDGTSEQVLKSRLLGGLFGSSLYDGAALRQMVGHYATDRLIDAVALESQQGRFLLVATTDLTSGEPVIWDLGSIARGGDERSKALFRDVLTASASVPGLFPPVVLHLHEHGVNVDEIHVDGDVTLPFFVTPSPEFLAPGDRVYVIIDGRLHETPKVTPFKARAIFTRSISDSLTYMRRAAVEFHSMATRQRGVDLEYVAIGESFPPHGPFDFRAETARTLFHYGVTRAEIGPLWAMGDRSGRQPDPQSMPRDLATQDSSAQVARESVVNLVTVN